MHHRGRERGGDQPFARDAAHGALDEHRLVAHHDEPERRRQRRLDFQLARAARNLHLALVQLPQCWFAAEISGVSDSARITCLRSVLMKPEHERWLDRIWHIFSEAGKE